MIEKVLHNVVNDTSYKDTLSKRNSSHPQRVQMCVKLATLKKHDMFVTDFFRNITRLTTELADADASIRDEEVLDYLLTGLR